MNDSLQLRRAAIAYLYQTGPQLTHQDNLAFYNEVQKHAQFPEFAQQPPEVVLVRRTPTSPEASTEVRVGLFTPQGVVVPPGMAPPSAFRFVYAEQGTDSTMSVISDLAESIFESFNAVWGGRIGRIQMIEVAVMATVTAQHQEGSIGLLRERFTRMGEASLAAHLGRNYNSYVLKLTSAPIISVGAPAAPIPMASANVDLTIEPFYQDPRRLFINLLVRWPAIQMRTADAPLPPEVKATMGPQPFIELNATPGQPANYLQEGYNYLEKNVLPFISAASRETWER